MPVGPVRLTPTLRVVAVSLALMDAAVKVILGEASWMVRTAVLGRAEDAAAGGGAQGEVHGLVAFHEDRVLGGEGDAEGLLGLVRREGQVAAAAV